MKTLIPILCCLFLCTSLFSQSDICGIDFLNGTRIASFANGEQVSLSFEYSTDEASGVRIFARPFSNGSLSSSYGASPSPLYLGSGTGTASFTITSGTITVDEIRFQIFTADQSDLLREFWVPVEYHFGAFGIHDFTFSAETTLGSFLIGEQVEIGFEYNASQLPDGVRIFIRPFTNGNLTPDYAASASPIFTGSGTHLVYFTLNSGTNVRVDSLRITVVNSDQTNTYQTFFIPVNWYWSSVKITDFTYGANNFYANGEDFTISYNFETTEEAGIRIFPRPVTNSGLTPGYGACGSGLYTGSGSSSCNFTITDGNQRVDHIRFVAYDSEQNNTLLELYLPVDLYFGNFQVANLKTCPPSPARLQVEERVHLYYDLTNEESSAARVFVRPLTRGMPSNGYGASASPTYAPGTNPASDFYTLSVPGQVDQSRFFITNADQTQNWATFFYAVDFTFEATTTSVGPSLEAAQFLSWNLAPNPVRENALFSMKIQRSHQLALRLVDHQGRIVKHLSQRKVVAGEQLTLDLPVKAWDLAPGVYYLQMQGQNYSTAEPLVVHQ